MKELYLKQLRQVFEKFYKNVIVKEVDFNYDVFASHVVIDTDGDPLWHFHRDKFGNWMGKDKDGKEHHFQTSYWHAFIKKVFALLSEQFLDNLLNDQYEYETYE